MKKNRFRIFVLLFLILIILTYFALTYSFLIWDENAYLGNARAVFSSSNYTEDNRFPLIELIIAVLWLFTGESVFLARLIMILFTAATIFLVYKISETHFRKPFIPTVFFATNFLVLYWGFRIYPDITGLFFILLSYFLLIKGRIFFSGVSASFAFLARFPNAIFGFSVCIFFLFSKKIKKIFIFLAGVFISLLPWLCFNTIRYQNPLWDLIDLFKQIGLYTAKEPMFYQLLNMFKILNSFALPVFIGFFFIVKHRKKKMNLLILIYFLLYMAYYFFMVNLKFDRYYIGILPFLYFIGYFWIESLKSKKIVHLSLIILFMLHFIFTLFLLYSEFRNSECIKDGGVIGKAIEYLKKEGIQNRTIISNSWPWFGYYLNSKVSSTWTNDISLLLQIYGKSYFVIIERGGLEFNLDILNDNTKVTLIQTFEDRCMNKAYIYRADALD